MASNEQWVVPASLDERRYLVLNVSDKKRANHTYFGAILKQMAAGGDAAMLHNLLAMDLTDFNVRDVPNTDGLQQQRKLSLPVPERWWLDVLHRHVFLKLGLEADLGKWLPDVSTELLFASYEEFAKQAHERRLMSREALGKFMVEMRAVPKRLSNAHSSASTSPTLRTCGAALSGRRRSFEAPGRQVTVSAACNFRVRIFARSLASPLPGRTRTMLPVWANPDFVRVKSG